MVLLLLALLLLAGTISLPGRLLERWAGDMRMRLVAPAPGDVPLVVIAIDEAALDTIGAWPWPRSRMAAWVERLFDLYRPAGVALDMVFPPGQPASEDEALAGTFAGHPALAAGQLLLPDAASKGQPRFMGHIDPRLPATFKGSLGNSPSIEKAAGQIGHINATVDSDGMLRRIEPASCTPQGCSLALGLALGAQLLGPTAWRLEAGGLRQSTWRLVPEGAEHLAVPLDEKFSAQVPWRAAAGVGVVSAAEVWKGSAPKASLENALVIVGVTAPGLGDIVATPVAPVMPGVAAHAAFLSAWLEGRLPFRPRLSPGLIAVILLAQGGVVLAFARRNAGAPILAGLAAGLTLAWLLSNAVAWRQGRDLPLLAPAFYPMLAISVVLLGRVLDRQKALLARIAAYVPKPLYKYLASEQPEPVKEVVWSTVMYADLVGYTEVSRTMRPEELALWGNAGVDLMIGEIERQGGHIDNVAGDGLLAYWRDGTADEQARRALDAAKAIRQSLAGIGDRLPGADWPALDIGIGIHAGPLMAGSFGDQRRRYTVLGEAANLAHRIERLTRKLPFRLLFSEAVAKACLAYPPKHVGAFALVDPEHPVELYTLEI